jgi:lysophospholipase L1-like esterase
VARPPAQVGLRANLLLLVASVGVALAALELVARALLPAPLPWRYPQLRYRPDPTLRFTLVPDQHGFSADKLVVINARGLRGPVIPYKRIPGRLRLLFLGDSITFGFGVEDSEVVAARVAARLNDSALPTEVINSSVPAYNTEQEVAYLETEGIRYAPDWVVVGVCWNDISDKADVRVSPEGWLIADASTSPTRAGRAMESAFAYAARNALKRSRLMYAALQGWRALPQLSRPDAVAALRSDVLEGRETPRVADGWAHLGEALARLAALSRARGFRAILVAFPIPLAVERSFPHSMYPARLRELAASTGLPMINLQEAFHAAYRGHESLFIAYDGDHPNPTGHDIAAREIARFLIAHVSAPPAGQAGS